MGTAAVAAGPVVVGVLGSQAALCAVEWAVDEAVSRRVSLRLVHAVDPADFTEKFTTATEFAVAALRTASSAAAACGRRLDIETAVITGTAEAVLLDESSTASLLCLGADGRERASEGMLGRTAEALARRAFCPVAVLGNGPPQSSRNTDEVVVAIAAATDDTAAMELALEEARLRRVSVLAVGVPNPDGGDTALSTVEDIVRPWRMRYAAMRLRTTTTHLSFPRYLAANPNVRRVVVIGAGLCPELRKIMAEDLDHRDRPESCVVIAR